MVSSIAACTSKYLAVRVGGQASGDPVRFVPGDGGQLAQYAGQADRVGLGEGAEQLGHGGRIPDRAGADMTFGGYRDVHQRRLSPVSGPHLEQLGPGGRALGRYQAGGDQARGQAGDGRLADRGEHVVGACRQRQQRYVAGRGRGDPGGAVATEADDHPRARRHHAPDGVHGVLRGLPDRLAVEELDLRPPAVPAVPALGGTP